MSTLSILANLILPAKNFLQKPDRVFVVLASFFGFIMVFCMPLFMIPDETIHFDRAYQVGGGHLTSQTIHGHTGGVVPIIPGVRYLYGSYVPPVMRTDYFRRLAPSATTFVSFPTSALYSAVAYAPQAIGVDVGRVFNNSLGSMMYGGRIANLAAYVLMVGLAIRIARRGKWVYATIGLFPVAIQQAASLSSDVMTIGLSFLTIAFVHNLFLQNHLLNRKQLTTLVGFAVGLGLTKQTNLVLLLSVLFLPKSLFASYFRKFITVGLVMSCGIVAALLWYLIIKANHYQLDYLISDGTVNQAGQLKHILKHPVSFLAVIFRTYVFPGLHAVPTADFYWLSLYGYFSLLIYKLPLFFIWLGYTPLLIATLYDGGERLLDRKEEVRIALLQTTIFLISLLAIATALYLVWTPVGSTEVLGIQGRYFIPVLPLMIPAAGLLRKKMKVTFRNPYGFGLFLTTVSIINLTGMLLLTYTYFSGFS